MRSDAKKRARNQSTLNELKNLSHKLASLESDPAEAEKFAQQAYSRYDKAVSKGIIPRGRADRRKSRIQAFITKLKSKKSK